MTLKTPLILLVVAVLSGCAKNHIETQPPNQPMNEDSLNAAQEQCDCLLSSDLVQVLDDASVPPDNPEDVIPNYNPSDYRNDGEKSSRNVNKGGEVAGKKLKKKILINKMINEGLRLSKLKTTWDHASEGDDKPDHKGIA